MALEVDQEDIFSSSGQYNSQQFHLSCPVWFNTITQIIETHVIDPIQEMGRVPQTHTTRQETSPIDQQTEKLDT